MKKLNRYGVNTRAQKRFRRATLRGKEYLPSDYFVVFATNLADARKKANRDKNPKHTITSIHKLRR